MHKGINWWYSKSIHKRPEMETSTDGELKKTEVLHSPRLDRTRIFRNRAFDVIDNIQDNSAIDINLEKTHFRSVSPKPGMDSDPLSCHRNEGVAAFGCSASNAGSSEEMKSSTWCTAAAKVSSESGLEGSYDVLSNLDLSPKIENGNYAFRQSRSCLSSDDASLAVKETGDNQNLETQMHSGTMPVSSGAARCEKIPLKKIPSKKQHRLEHAKPKRERKTETATATKEIQTKQTEMQTWKVCLRLENLTEHLKKKTMVEIISDISGFRINESVICVTPIDKSVGTMVVLVKCPTQSLHDEFLEVVQEVGIPACSQCSIAVQDADATGIRTNAKALPKAKVSITFSNLSKEHMKIDKKVVVDYIGDIADLWLDEEELESDGMNGAGDDSLTFRMGFDDEVSARNFMEKINKISSDAGFSVALLTAEELAIQDLWDEIFDKAQRQVEQHHKKLTEVSREMQYIEDVRKFKKRWTNLQEFERKWAKLKPLKTKFDELHGQESEFSQYVNRIQDKVFQLVNATEFKSEADILRTDFELELKRFSSALPMYAKRSAIIKTVRENRVSIILGETGSGKSTQILQYLHYAGFTDQGLIVCTQPRKVAAVSLATRVAQEMGCRVGQLVGYQVGMQVKRSQCTKILFVTDHILLNSCLKDRLFSKYSCVVIDEAHERSIYTDLLLGFVKRGLEIRDDLKVLITSATINPEILVRYFGGSPPPPVVDVPGRVFPVEVFYEKYASDLSGEDYVATAVEKAIWIHENQEPGDVLVFLTNPLETEKACKSLRARCGERNVLALECNGRLQLEDQQKVFEPTPPGKRKVVFATNSVETSVTIPGVKYVVDTGRIREMAYDPKKKMSVLSLAWTTKSSADQRKGRAGRTDCGHCYRLYTEDQYREMRKDSVPEILRINLGQALLKLLMLGIVDPGSFDFVESPKQEAIGESLALLEELGAYSVGAGITEIGKQLAQISVEPRLGKVVLRGIDEGLGYETMILTAVWSAGGSVFFRGGSQEDKQRSDKTKTRFCDEWGDGITGAMIYKEWDTIPLKNRGIWCKTNNINGKTMKCAQDILKEIFHTFQQDLKMTVSKKLSDDPKLNEKLAVILFDCYQSNLARYLGHEKIGYCLASNPKDTALLHPSSSLHSMGELPKWVIYDQILTTTGTFMTNVTYVDESWINDRLSSGRLNVNVEKLESEIPVSRKIDGLGRQCITKLVEQKAQGLQDLEKRIKQVIPFETSRVCIHLDSNKRCLVMYADRNLEELVMSEVLLFLGEIRTSLKEEMLEERIKPGSDVRFVLGSGLAVKSVLMPSERRQVTVFCTNRGPCDMQHVRDMLNCFGEIESYTTTPSFKSRNFTASDSKSNCNTVIGYVTFKNEENAALAVANTLSLDFRLEFSTKSSADPRSKAHFRVKVEVCRRPLTGRGHVQFRTHYARNEVLGLMRYFLVKRQDTQHDTVTANVGLTHNRRNPDEAFLNDIPEWATPHIVKQGLIEAIANESLSKDIMNVVLIRRPPPNQAEDQMQMHFFREKIRRELLDSGTITTRDYEVEMHDPKDKDFTMFAYLKFTDHDKANVAADVLDGASFNEQKIEAKFDLRTTFVVSSAIHNLCIGDVRAEIQLMSRTSVGRIAMEVNRRVNGSYLIQVETSEANDLRQVRTRLESVIHGQRIDLTSGKFLRLKLDDAFRKRDEIQRKVGVRIRLDDRQQAVIIYGKLESIAQAKHLIEEYLSQTKSSVQKDLDLKDRCYPRGITKALVAQYGLNLERLKMQCGAFSLDLNLKRHVIRFNGSKESYDHLKTLIATTADQLPGPRQESEPTPECAVCFNNVDYDDCYVTESCGHFYCTDCCCNLIRNGLTSNDIPIRCALDSCSENLTLRDFHFLLRNIEETFEPAIRTFISKNNKEFIYCSTPDCPSFYRKTSKHAEEFACSICHVSLCTMCGASYHGGVTCAVYNRLFDNADDNLRVWLKGDLERRTLCPDCGIGIEKNEGCNHVECSACKTHICWNCKKSFATSESCYQHLRIKHGGFYDDEHLNQQLLYL